MVPYSHALTWCLVVTAHRHEDTGRVPHTRQRRDLEQHEKRVVHVCDTNDVKIEAREAITVRTN